MLTSLHIEGDSWLHRTPTGLKLSALLLAGLVLMLIDWPLLHAVVLSIAIALAASIGLSPSLLWQRTRPVLITIALLALVNYLLLTPRDALITALRLPAIVVLASIVTATTALSAFIDCLTGAARPLERLGLMRAADLGLAVGLVLRFVPEISQRLDVLKQAHQARGIPFRLHRALGPLMISVLKDADSITEAIDARGIRGQNTAIGKRGERP